jgi:predicted transcriptional regulator
MVSELKVIKLRFQIKKFVISLLGIVLSLVVCSALQAAASPLLIGREAPPFHVESGDGKVLQSKMLRGKVVVLFYESKDVLAKSRPLKKILNDYYQEQKKEDQQMILRVPIINCNDAAWPIKGIWKSSLVANSKRVGMTVYGDWDGKMGIAYGMKGDDTNLLILDKRGIIRYFKSGVVTSNGETAAILTKLLKGLVAENNADKIIPKQS